MYKFRELNYRQQIKQKDELMKDITNKLVKYSKLLQENPNDPMINDMMTTYV